MENEIAKVEQKEVVLKNQSPMEAMQIALNNNVDLDKIEKMIELQAKWDAIQAEKAYAKAMSEFKKNPPIIIKDKKVGFESKRTGGTTNYSHATLGKVCAEVTKALAAHGFSASWKPTQPEGKIRITCTITHEMGHKDSAFLEAPADTTGNKNGIQAMGSTMTYLERYTFLGLCGLATHDQDDDGEGFGKAGNGDAPKISEDGVKNLEYEMTLRHIDETKFFVYFQKETGMQFNALEDVTEAYYDRVLNEIQKKEVV